MLQKQVSTAEKISVLNQKIKDLTQSANKPFTGEIPDKFLLDNRDKINALVERRQTVIENYQSQIQTEKQIVALTSGLEKLQFTSVAEYENAKSEYEKEKSVYAEKLLRQQIATENESKKIASFKKIKIAVNIVSGLLCLIAAAGLIFKIDPLAVLFLAVIAPFVLKKPQASTFEELHKPEDKNAFFNRQYELLKQKDELEKLHELANKLQKTHSDFMQELQIFKAHISEKISDSGADMISMLQQKLNNAVRNEIQFEMYRKNSAANLNEAEKIRETVAILQNSTENVKNTDELKNELAQTERLCTGIYLRKQQLNDKNSLYSKLESEYFAAKNNFNIHLKQYLKWKTALNIWEKTVNVFEKERQGDVMQRASELFSRITGGRYLSVRKAVAKDGNLVVFDGKNDKTVDKLSSGTREQLLFVLRLALIEYIEKNAPQNIAMPLLMDDIFVNYDHKREQYAWDILKDFSCNRQIIFCRAKETTANA